MKNFSAFGPVHAAPKFLYKVCAKHNKLVDLNAITLLARLMYLCLDEEDGRVFCTYASLEESLGLTKNQSQSAVKRLKAQNLITTEPAQNGRYYLPNMPFLRHLADLCNGQKQRGKAPLKQFDTPVKTMWKECGKLKSGDAVEHRGDTLERTTPIGCNVPQKAPIPFKANKKEKTDPSRVLEEFGMERLNDPDEATKLLMRFAKESCSFSHSHWKKFFREAQNCRKADGFLLTVESRHEWIYNINPILLKEAVTCVIEKTTHPTVNEIATTLLRDRAILEQRCRTRFTQYFNWRKAWELNNIPTIEEIQ